MLEIKNLQASIQDEKQQIKSILRGVNLSIKPGEVHAIMGPNGSGKSTLANILAGREDYQVSDGSVTLDGEDILSLSPEERAARGLFLAFQYPTEIAGVNNMYFLRTALDILSLSPEERAARGLFLAFQYPTEIAGVNNMYFLRTALNSLRKQKGLSPLDAADFLSLVKIKMKEVGLSETFLHRAVNEGFSGGEKKRNEVLQMLMLEPRFIILDETDSGLDIDALQTVGRCVTSLRSESRSMLVITHYQRLLEYIRPDVVHVMARGKILKSGHESLAHELEAKGYGWLGGDLAS